MNICYEEADDGEGWEFRDWEPPEPRGLEDDGDNGFDVRWDDQFGFEQPRGLGARSPVWPADLIEDLRCCPSAPALWHLLPLSALVRVVRTGVLRARSSTTPGWSPGDAKIIETRRTKPVDVWPGGVVNDYVPFYLTPDTPYAYHASRKVDDLNESQRLAFVVLPFRSVQDLPWVGTTLNAAASGATFFNNPQEVGRFNWSLIASPYSDSSKAARQGEILVHNEVPLDCVGAVLFCSQPAQWRLEQLQQAAPEAAIHTRPEVFYQA